MSDTINPIPTPSTLNTKKIVENRRLTMEELVHTKMGELKKPITHTGLFHEIFPGHEEGKEAIMKWNDIGRVLTKKVNSGEYTMKKVEGKRRTTFEMVVVENTQMDLDLEEK